MINQNTLHLAQKVPIMLLGAPGIGKTAVVTQFAKSMNADMIDIRLCAQTPSSFEGKDYICPQSGHLKKARAWWLLRLDVNRENDMKTVLFFDEYTNAPDALQQLAYSPFNERKLHGLSFDYKLKNGENGLYVFGAGNRVEDETGAREMVHATKTRVFTVDFEISADEWVEWAQKSGISEKVTAFIYANLDALLEKPSTGTACPRQWANLSYALEAGIDCRKAAHGTIRGAHEAKFCAYYKDSALCPTIEDIVNGRAKTPELTHLSAFAATLGFALKKSKKITEYFPVVFQWIKEINSDCAVVFIKIATTLLGDKLLFDETCKKILSDTAYHVGIA